MSILSLHELLQVELERALTPYESEVLRHLTPAGVAKVNADICKGIMGVIIIHYAHDVGDVYEW